MTNTKYHNTNYFLCLYYSIRYYLKEQAIVSQKPVNKEELFNFCYFILQNIVKSIFSDTKHQFQIFKTLTKFTIDI